MTPPSWSASPTTLTELEQRGWTVTLGGRPDVFALNSGHYFADGDGVSLLLRFTGDDVLVSDGGVMKLRLHDAQVDLSSERARAVWNGTLRDFELVEADDRIVGRKGASSLMALLTDLVDAMLTLDGLKVLARQPQMSRLERQLYTFLDEAAVPLTYEKRPRVQMPRGTEVRPTALVHAPGRDIYVQTTSNKDNVSRASFVVEVLRRANIDLNQRLVVFKGTQGDWEADYVDLLSELAMVGFMERPRQLTELLLQR